MMNASDAPGRALGSLIRKIAMGVVAILVAGFLSTTLSPSTPVAAATGSDFNAGRIVSDSVFYASTSLNVDQTQAFLNSQVSSCRSGYTCLKDYGQATPNIAADRYCPGGFAASGRDSAAAIIVKAAVGCGISPKVLLVLLQKEQSLVTDTWPTTGQYNAATGFSCPDTAPCDTRYSGFAYQVYYAARQFQVYAQNPTLFNYRSGRVNTILYNPNRACGTKDIFIENQATASLYVYTPYTPNAAALNNLYGTGDGCSAYGNRNFWRLYTDWFGSTISGIDSKDAISLIYALYDDILLRTPDEGGVNTWRNYLIGQGWPTVNVANGILYSDEYFLQRIDAAYQEVLGRGPDPIGRADWLNRMRTGTTSVDEIRMTFTRSQEYYDKAGATDEGYVAVLYRTMLGRDAAPGDIAYWVNQIRLRGHGYVANAIWNSFESGTIRLTRIYNQFLDRGIDAGGISSWVPLLTSQGDQAARSAVVSSLEYLLKARDRYPQG